MTKLLVMGLGYVGLPLAQQAVAAGMDVTGCDISEKRVRMLNAGQSPIDDLTDDNIAEMLAAGFLATSTPRYISQGPDVMVICVPTPLSETDGPDLAAVIAAAKTAGRLLKPGALVVLESTTYPGTTDNTACPTPQTKSAFFSGDASHLPFPPRPTTPSTPAY